MSLLQIKKISKYFGKVGALEGVDIEINEGEEVGIVGPNGSGKTTLINVISGFYKPSDGAIFYKGKQITGLRPDQISSMGVMRTFQANVIYGDATVYENILRSSYLMLKTGNWGQFLNMNSHRTEQNLILGRVEELLVQFDLAKYRDMRAQDLPHGSQRVLGIAMGVAPKPNLLMLDEPMTGMNDEEVQTMLSHIKGIRKQGITILMVEHNMKAMLSASKRMIVLDFGHVIADGLTDTVVNTKEVIECYIGGDEKEYYA